QAERLLDRVDAGVEIEQCLDVAAAEYQRPRSRRTSHHIRSVTYVTIQMQMTLRAKRSSAWLLIVHLLPLRPVNARVKTLRRRQAPGAVALKTSVYGLPNTDQTREALEWIKPEVEAMHGEATVFTADSLESFSHDEIVAAFRKAREADYAALVRDAEDLALRM